MAFGDAQTSLVQYQRDDTLRVVQVPTGSGSDSYNGAVYDEAFKNDSGATIVAGTWVKFDHTAALVNGQIRNVVATAAADEALTVGVVTQDIGDGEWGVVRREGQIQALVAALTPAASALQISGTAGTAEAAGATTERTCGVSLSAVAAGKALVEVRCRT